MHHVAKLDEATLLKGVCITNLSLQLLWKLYSAAQIGEASRTAIGREVRAHARRP